MTTESHFRDATSEEKKLIHRLLEAQFPGKSEVARQLGDCRVRKIDNDGSLEIEVQAGHDPAPTTKRVPIEAEGKDEDGVGVHVLLHVVEGMVKEVEIYKDDGSPVRRIPGPRDLTLILLPPEHRIGA
jgi:hypothetical protein